MGCEGIRGRMGARAGGTRLSTYTDAGDPGPQPREARPRRRRMTAPSQSVLVRIEAPPADFGAHNGAVTASREQSGIPQHPWNPPGELGPPWGPNPPPFPARCPVVGRAGLLLRRLPALPARWLRPPGGREAAAAAAAAAMKSCLLVIGGAGPLPPTRHGGARAQSATAADQADLLGALQAVGRSIRHSARRWAVDRRMVDYRDDPDVQREHNRTIQECGAEPRPGDPPRRRVHGAAGHEVGNHPAARRGVGSMDPPGGGTRCWCAMNSPPEQLPPYGSR